MISLSVLVAFEVPGYVQPKQRTFGNRFVTPPETRSYERLVGMVAKVAMKGGRPYSGFVALDLLIYCTIPRSWTKRKRELVSAGILFPTHCDLDNQVKAISDGMNKIVFSDDRFITQIAAQRWYGPIDKAVVTVSALIV